MPGYPQSAGPDDRNRIRTGNANEVHAGGQIGQVGFQMDAARRSWSDFIRSNLLPERIQKRDRE
jgi:hypothetical protein